MVKQRCLQIPSRGCPKPVGRPHYVWMDGAMQDLSTLESRLQLDLLRGSHDRDLWRGGCQPVLLKVLVAYVSFGRFQFWL